MGKKNISFDPKEFTFAYFPGNSLFHKLNPLSKILFLLYLTIITLITKSLIILFTLAVISIILSLFSGFKLKDLFRKLRFMISILIVSVILNIFFNAIPSNKNIILFYLFGVSWLPIRRLAVYYALKAFFLILILFTSTLIYTNTTSMKDFTYSLMRLNIPYKYCFSFMVGIRFLPTIEYEARTISLAQKARGFGSEKINSVKKAYNLIFERLTSTLINILRKAHTTSISMENRGFGVYKTRTNMVKIKFKAIDIFFMIMITFIFIFVIMYLFGLIPLYQFPSLYSIYLQFS